MLQKPIAEKQFLNPDHENVDHYAKERPHKRTSPLPPLAKEKKFKGLLDIRYFTLICTHYKYRH